LLIDYKQKGKKKRFFNSVCWQAVAIVRAICNAQNSASWLIENREMVVAMVQLWQKILALMGSEELPSYVNNRTPKYLLEW